ncbi:HpcH/HpaI aldolase family protein [Chelativorans sp. YIM 93263]|uniref:HpcH/HpaI aldolase family protein n=1 Tax=Chelativorans sp. YIM 93263 TaxID=2906648 RepID=UPI0023794018|nr:HpcH/HpaI aldolase/citrate lyase family protein [Chelativorans sp. YIM 93263]
MELPKNTFKRDLSRTPPMIGTWSMSASPVMAEALGCCGYDFVVLDMEHTPNDVPQALSVLQALAGTPAACLTRLPWNDAVTVKRILDCGAQSLMFPFIESVEAAKAAVAATRYPPRGIRGAAGMSRASRFGAVENYFSRAEEEICVTLQVETVEALKCLPDIAAVEGVDSLFIGPSDISASLGLIGQIGHETVQETLVDAAKACRAAGKPCGILVSDAAMARRMIEAGYSWISIGSDLTMATSRARETLVQLRD